MQLITKSLPNSHNIFIFGDLHDGSVLSSGKGWSKLINLMQSEYDGCSNNFGIDGGDMIEAITVDDKRFSQEKLTEPLPIEQMKQAIKKREPIKDKLITILQGNHELALWRFGDITKEVCEVLGVEYGTYTCKVTILDGRGNLMYKMFDMHGRKGLYSSADDPIRVKANMRLQLKRHLKNKAGDCILMVKHHAHKLIVAPPQYELYVTDDGKKLKQNYTEWGQNEPYIHPDARWFGCAGAFLRLYGDGISGYAERAEYDPVELGFLVWKVRDRKVIGLEPYYLKDI